MSEWKQVSESMRVVAVAVVAVAGWIAALNGLRFTVFYGAQNVEERIDFVHDQIVIDRVVGPHHPRRCALEPRHSSTRGRGGSALRAYGF